MDVADGSTETSAMIALLPINADWCKQVLPHMTLVYAGEIGGRKDSDFNEMAKDAASVAMVCGVISLSVMGVEVFGDTEKVDVLRFQPSSEVLAMRRMVEKWNMSEFPFRPHATIGPIGSSVQIQQMSEIPRRVAFDRVYVGWGEESMTFLLNTRRYG